jgi:hypothetical protein
MYFFAGTLIMGLVAALGAFPTVDDDKPKHDIKEIMDLAHKKGLLKKVVSGQADGEQKKVLLGLYVDLAKNKPPKGEEGDWKERTEAIVTAAKAVVEDKEDAPKKLAAATKCMDCHSRDK